MIAAPTAPGLDRFTRMGDLTLSIRRTLNKSLTVLAVSSGGALVYLAVSGAPGMTAFGMMAAGALFVLYLWANGGLGVPLLPMIALQQFLVNALPILTRHSIASSYPESYVTRAGIEVIVFLVTLGLAWRTGMQMFTPAGPTAYVLTGIEREGMRALIRVGFIFVGVATSYLFLQTLGFTGTLLQSLPNGSLPIILAITASASACGFFLLAMIVGSGGLPTGGKIAFWLLMVTNCVLSAAGLLLSAAGIVVFAVWIGLFWGTGRVPWRYTLVVFVTISFFNTGKYAMRARYWQELDQDTPPVLSLGDVPSFYAEWSRASFESFAGTKTEDEFTKFGATPSTKRKEGDQSLLDRLNNLQNLLFVIEAVERDHVEPLGGDTYAVIPPLLIPRILWPGKPRAHEGQIMLNVHFGRQDLESTFKTYVAWGLLAEAYGNFGAIKGALLLGLALGLLFAWAENLTARKPLLSTEGFIAFIVFSGLSNSYEMVSSVLVTSIFQSVLPVALAASPFVRRSTLVRPESDPAPA